MFLSFFWIVGISNAFNLLDVFDGICATVFLIAAGFLAFFAALNGDYYSFIILSFLFFSVLGFMFLNFPPAKIYMGNAGSHFLGFVLAVLSMRIDYASADNVFAVFVPLAVLAVPIFDTAYLLYIRPRKKIMPIEKSNDHISMQLAKAGVSPRKVLLVFALTSFLYGALGIGIYIYGFKGVVVTAFVSLIIVFLLYRFSLRFLNET